jgi:hypothetical protein
MPLENTYVLTGEYWSQTTGNAEAVPSITYTIL